LQPGEYQICFDMICNSGVPDCKTGCTVGPKTLAHACYDFVVHQSKDAFKIVLEEKWNLISLPLVPFDTDIDAMLASLDTMRDVSATVTVNDLISIWNYDCTVPEWLCYTPDGAFDTLATIEDGKSYWFRLSYPVPTYGWWVFGTEKPEPYGPPAEYDVCQGWNMFGYTNFPPAITQQAYLWNWQSLGWQPAPVVYGWNNAPDWFNQGWTLIAAGDFLTSGQGYWGAFPVAGKIYVP